MIKSLSRLHIYMNAIAQQYLKVPIEKLCQLSETVSWGIRAVLKTLNNIGKYLYEWRSIIV